MNNTDKDNLLNSLKQMNDEFNPNSPHSYKGLMRLVAYVLSCNENDPDILAVIGEMLDKAMGPEEEKPCECTPRNKPPKNIREMEFDIDFNGEPPHEPRTPDEMFSMTNDPDAPIPVDWDALRKNYYLKGSVEYSPFDSKVSGRNWNFFPESVKKMLSYRLACPQSREKNYHTFER